MNVLKTTFSFVRSVSMDKWKDLELEKMKAGGNRNAKEFFESQSDFRADMSLQEKYNSRAAALYRDKVRIQALFPSNFFFESCIFPLVLN